MLIYNDRIFQFLWRGAHFFSYCASQNYFSTPQNMKKAFGIKSYIFTFCVTRHITRRVCSAMQTFKVAPKVGGIQFVFDACSVCGQRNSKTVPPRDVA